MKNCQLRSMGNSKNWCILDLVFYIKCSRASLLEHPSGCSSKVDAGNCSEIFEQKFSKISDDVFFDGLPTVCSSLEFGI